MPTERREDLPLPEAVTHLLEECRMVLPGVQALFGFQLIAVFSEGFEKKLSAMEQGLHLLALGVVAVAVALVMTPAALHRRTPMEVSQNFVKLASRLLLWAMIPLMLAIALEFYLIARVILATPRMSILLTVVLLSIFGALWFLLPRSASGQRRTGGRD